MPVYAQIICIGGNGLFAFFFGLAGLIAFGKGENGQSSPGLGTFLLLLSAAALYSMWVLVKFRRYLGAEQALEREAHIAELRRQLAIKDQSPETPPAAGGSGAAP